MIRLAVLALLLVCVMPSTAVKALPFQTQETEKDDVRMAYSSRHHVHHRVRHTRRSLRKAQVGQQRHTRRLESHVIKSIAYPYADGTSLHDYCSGRQPVISSLQRAYGYAGNSQFGDVPAWRALNEGTSVDFIDRWLIM